MKRLSHLIMILFFLVISAYIYDLTFITTGKTSLASVESTAIIPGCGDLVCSFGENCPLDNVSCTDIKCYEPTCENGCGLSFVANGLTDEACYRDTGCSGSSCICDGTGNCISSAPVVPGGGGGGGGAPPRKPKNDFTLSEINITLSIFEGETTVKTVVVNNTGKTTLEFAVDTKSLTNLVFLSDYTFELKPNETKTLTIMASASSQFPADVYTGHIIFTGDDISKSIITVVEIKSREALFDVLLRVRSDYKTVYQGDLIYFDIKIKNMGTMKPVDIEQETVLKDMFNFVVLRKSETFAVFDEANITRNMTIPSKAIPQNYVVYAKIIYANKTAISSDIITVIERQKILIPDVARYTYMIVILLFVMLIIAYIAISSLMQQLTKKKPENVEEHIVKILDKTKKRKN